MRKVKERILNSIDSNWLKFAFGIFVCLLATFCSLSYTPSSDGLILVARFINWCLSFLVGSYLSFAVYALMFLFGLSLVFSTQKRVKVNLDLTIFGVTIIIVGALILISNGQTTNILEEQYLTFANFEKIFNETLINDFPKTDLFNNSGIIGMFLVALINSGMTNIGSNVIGSVLICFGAFFALAKPAIKFAKIIYEYYRQVFGKRQLLQTEGYDVAKDVSYDTHAIRAIKLNQEQKREEEKVEQEASTLTSPTFNETTQENTEQVFRTKKLVENNNVGFVKAKFDLNEPQSTFMKEPIKEEVQEVRKEPIETPIEPKKSYQEELQERYEAYMKQKRQENGNQETHFISEMFTVPKTTKQETVVENKVETITQTNPQEVEPEINFRAPEIEDNSSNNFEEPLYNESYEEPLIDTSFVTEPEIDNVSSVQFSRNQESTSITEKPLRTKEEQDRIDKLAIARPQNYEETEYTNKIVEDKPKKKDFILPTSDLLTKNADAQDQSENIEVADARTEKINELFEDFKVGAKVVSYTIGPSVTQYDVQTERNVSINGVGKCIQDISVRLGGLDTRFVPIVAGKSTSGIEIANKDRSVVYFKDCLNDLNDNECSKLTIPFGKDIAGNYISADLADFPHLLVCGTTGSGKSIFVHSLIMALIMRNTPDELKLVMIDPKRVEFGKYKEIAHLMCPPVTDTNLAYNALNKLVDLMEERYSMFEKVGVSNIKQYNKEAFANGKEKLPFVVLVCDEFADLMDTNRKCSEPVVRIGQKARAAGIHMIIATQRPSVNVITGVIKANLPVRVALSCSSTVDSQTILGEGGAEKLLGNGDMLVMCPLLSKNGFTRVQGCFVDNKEIKDVCDFIRSERDTEYEPSFLELEDRCRVNNIDSSDRTEIMENAFEEKYEEIKRWVMTQDYSSMSKIQREFQLGFPRANKIFLRLEEEGVVEPKRGGNNNAKGRKVLLHIPAPTSSPNEHPGDVEVTTFTPHFDSNGEY